MKNLKNINIIAPSILLEQKYSEAEILGAMVLLWSQQSYYKEISVASMLSVLIPIIKTRQFALISDENRPVGYLVWAFMDEDTENTYLQNSGEIERFIGCNNGDQLWFLSIFSQEGQSKTIIQIAREVLFPYVSGKSLYHRGRSKGFRILYFHGVKSRQYKN